MLPNIQIVGLNPNYAMNKNKNRENWAQIFMQKNPPKEDKNHK